MKSIKGLALRFFVKNKFVAVSSITSVIISVALVITMLSFMYNAKDSLRNEAKEMYGEMDLSVGYSVTQNKNMDGTQLTQISSIKEIEKVSKVVITRARLDRLNSAEIYTVGVENDFLVKSRYHFTVDISESDIIINEKLAASFNAKITDIVMIENKPYTIKEIIQDTDAAGITPDIIIMAKSAAQNIILKKTRKEIEASYLLITVKKNSDPVLVANSILQQYPDVRIDMAQEDEFIKSNLASLNVFLIVLSVLILLITSLIIIANFEIYIYKYRNQLAIMRALGATPNQMYKIVLIQSSIISVIGSVGGLLVAYLVNELLQGYLERLLSINDTTGDFRIFPAALLMLACMVTIQFFMLFPSYRISKVLPISIMRENENIDFSQNKIRKKAGKYTLFTSLIFISLIVIGSALGETVEVTLVLFPLLLFIISIVLLFPIYITTVIKLLLPAIKLLFGKTSYVAVKNVIPQVKKNSLIMMSIVIMMIISIFGSAMLQLVSKGGEQYLHKQYVTDVVAVSRLEYKSNINHLEFHNSIKSIPGVTAVSEISTPYIAELLKGKTRTSFDYILGNLEEMSKQGILPALNGDAKNIIVVTENFANQNNIRIGEKIELGLYSVKDQKVIPAGEFVVSNIVKELPGSPLPTLMDWENKIFKNDHTRFYRAFIQTNEPTQILEKLERLSVQYPEIKFNSLDQSIIQSREMFKQRWSIFNLFLFIILLCVMLGVFGTLINNIYSKRKEYAILRTMSIGSNGLRKIIISQVMLYLFLGIVFGTLMGMIVTLIINLIDIKSGLVTFDFTNLVVIVIVLITIACMIFVPYANVLSKKRIAIELNYDNK